METTGCPSSGAGQDLRRTRAMPDFGRVSMPVLSKIVSRASAFNSGFQGDNESELYAKKVTTMLNNMVNSNIHPLAFFATIADYETYETRLGGFPWAEVGKAKWGSDLYRAGYCGSPVCTGVFQVLVYGDWHSWAQELNGKGVGIWGMKGGPDWTSTLWWWTNSRDNNCTYLSGGSNPCTTPGVRWTVTQHVRNGRRAYGQQKQCGLEWDAMYWSYMNAMKNSSDALVKRVTAIDDFATEVGLKSKTGASD
ncbi:MAG: hypothetical protein RIR26_2414 [Pseudomonadota bacterium]